MKKKDRKLDKLGFENKYLKSLILLTLIFVFLSPVIVYFIVFLISHITPIELLDRIKIGNSETWIGFAGSIIGGSMTMFAVVFTLFYESISRKKERALDSLPIISISPILDEDDNTSEIVHGQDELWIKLKITNISSNHARNINIELEKFTVSALGKSEEIDLADEYMMMNYSINTITSNSQNEFYLKIASKKLDEAYAAVFNESKIYVTFYILTKLFDIYQLEPRFFRTTLNGYLLQNDIPIRDCFDSEGNFYGEEYDKFRFRPAIYYTDLK